MYLLQKVLHLRVLNIQYLHECLDTELKTGETNFVILLLCWTSKANSRWIWRIFQQIKLNLDGLVQKHSVLVVLIGEFNGKSKIWYKINKYSFEGNIIENATSQSSLWQIIKEAMHILDNSSSCIDLIFTSKTSSLIQSGVHPSLH